MGSIRDIKRRIKSVGNTQQITKAMNLVSTSKLQRSKRELIASRPFYNTTRKIINDIVKNSIDIQNIFIKKREIKKSLIVVFTSDKGLCGGYNINILKESFNKIKDKENVTSIMIGSKGIEYFSDRNIEIKESFKGFSENISYENAKKIADVIIKLYESNEVDEVFLAYTKFESTISYLPKIEQILPIDISNLELEDEKEKCSKQLMIYEPTEEDVLSYLIPLYINTLVYGSLLESVACEQGSRMTSMDSATKNAEEAIDNMTIIYNRARQSAITQEITEIVSGANAL